MGIDMQTIQSALQETLTTLLTTVTLFLPRLLTALVLLLLGWLLGRLAAALLDRLLARLNFDRLLERSGLDEALGQAGVSIRPSHVLARLVYWLLLLAFVLAAVDALGLQAVAGALQDLVGYIPNLIGAVLVLIGGALLARFAGQATQMLAAGTDLEFHRGLGQGTQYLLLALTFILAVGQLGLDVRFLGGAVTNLLIVVVAALGLAFALGGRDVVRNMLAGFYAKELYELGQVMQIQTYRGTLEAIGTLKATIATEEGVVTLPNSLLISEVVTGSDKES
ncbi:MAG: mechanosensitive ion channel [Anaerolineales bacterium]|nr:MAG: mechanosensitive ion channel [Anaerolineales bacterium]